MACGVSVRAACGFTRLYAVLPVCSCNGSVVA